VLYWTVFSSDRINVARQLLAHGADPNLSNLDGMTPLKVAQELEYLDIVALLKQAGAKK
jgi:ankyrin repeat protein